MGLGALSAAGMSYYGTPKYTRVGYAPQQPIGFSHQLHAGQLAMDCRYCHNHVGESPHSNIPAAQTCINCHGKEYGNIKSDSPELSPLHQAWDSGKPVEWVKVHKVPDYAYFNHAVHINRGVGCVSCHGQVNQMPVVFHAKPLSMGWCLECHRDPSGHLRPASEVTNLNWKPQNQKTHEAFVQSLIDDAGISPPQNCSACHR